MLFNSYEFILVYLPITLVGYYALAKYFGNIFAKYFLIAMSLAFYSYWDIRNLPILLISIAVNYLFGVWISIRKDKLVLAAGVIFNLLLLGYFKYTDFLLQNISHLFFLNISLANIALPLGISFFTFTQTAYLVDVYRGGTNEYSPSDCLLFVTIFPHLIAGPILYHKDVIPQFSQSERYRVNFENLSKGLAWFIIGLTKKVCIADKLGCYADRIFNNTLDITLLDAWFGSFAYTLQLYYDFSGYSEMAIGLGLMFNYNLPINFNMPYRSSSIIEFWRCWHMTLSSFLKNYLYIPLGGNRNSHHMRNIFMTMFLGGLWHGAGWTYIFWGCLHGIYICINHLWRKTGVIIPKFLSWFITINAVNFAWIFFRASDFDNAKRIICRMFDFNSFYLPTSNFLNKHLENALPVMDLSFNYSELAFLLISGFVCIKIVDTNELMERFKPSYYWVFGLGIIAAYILLIMSSVESQFIYFQF